MVHSLRCTPFNVPISRIQDILAEGASIPKPSGPCPTVVPNDTVCGTASYSTEAIIITGHLCVDELLYPRVIQGALREWIPIF